MCPTVARHTGGWHRPLELSDASRMSREPYTLTNITNRIRMSSPGIAAAIVLTVAAAGFLAATFFGRVTVTPIAEVAPLADQQHSQHSAASSNNMIKRTSH